MRRLTHVIEFRDASCYLPDTFALLARACVSPVFAYFNNDPEGVAVKNALTLRRLMSDSASTGVPTVDA